MDARLFTFLNEVTVPEKMCMSHSDEQSPEDSWQWCLFASWMAES